MMRRWRLWRWRRTHQPYDWRVECPELLQTPGIRRVWPDPEPFWPEVRPVFMTLEYQKEDAYDPAREAPPEPRHTDVSTHEQRKGGD